MRTSSPLSLSSFVVVSLTLIFLSVYWFPTNAIAWDVFGYYLYLPMTFIYNDLSLQNPQVVRDIIETYNSSSTFYQAFELPNGNWVMKYSAGMAIFYLPAFVFGHVVALLSEYPADGFSFPYQLGMFIEMVAVAILGLWFLRKALLYFFNDRVVAFVIAVVFFGTNYLINITLVAAGTQTHNYLFLAYALILWLTIKWEESRSPSTIILLGLVCGLAILSRPSEIVCLFIPLFWTVTSWKSLWARLELLIRQWRQVAMFAIAVLAVGSIQLIYWRYVTGHFLHYSYVDAGEGGEAGIAFNFWQPHIKEVLFSFRKGWFIYTPAMLLALFGLIFGWMKDKRWSVASLVFFVFNLWIVSSWHCWWYAESFGQRSLVQSYPIMAFGLAGIMALPAQKWQRSVSTVLIAATVALNLFQSYQYKEGVIDASRQTKMYYTSSFFDTEPDASKEKLKLVKRDDWANASLGNDEDYFVVEISNLTFEDGKDVAHLIADSTFAKNGRYSGYLEGPFSTNVETQFDYLTSGHYVWLRLSAYIYPLQSVEEHPISLVMETKHGKSTYKYHSKGLENTGLQVNTWNYVELEYLSPEMRFRDDVFKGYIWNRGENRFYLDDYKLEVLIPKFDPER